MRTRYVIGLVMLGGLLGLHCGGSQDEESMPPEESAAWLSFGHDGHNTRHNALEDTITAETVAGLAPKWEIVGPNVTSTPAVADGVVYHADWTGTVHARDAETGSAMWSAKITQAEHIAASPLVTDDAVFIGDMTGIFYSLDREKGDVNWSVELDAHSSADVHGSALAVDDIVIVGVSSGELGDQKDDYTFRGSVVALDAATGAERWRVYMTTDDDQAGAGVSVWSSPAIDEDRGLMFIGTGNTYEPPASPRSDAIVAVNYKTGEVAWVRQFTEGDVYTLFMERPQGPDSDIGAAPNLFSIDGQDVVGAGDKAGVYAALDRDTGDVVWMRQLTEGSHLGGVMVAAAYADETVYVVSNRWPDGFDTEAVWIPNFQNPRNSSELFALNATNGDIRWSEMLPTPTLGAVAVAGGVVYTGTADGQLRGFDAKTGALLWQDRTGFSMASGQTIVDGVLYTGHGFEFIGLASGAPPGETGGIKAYALPEG